MSTFTIRVTSSATNVAGTAYGQQPDLGTPSFLDMYITGSTDPLVPNGQYDAYCLNPLIDINLSPTTYTAENSAGTTAASFVPIGFSALSQTQVDQVNWLLSQNFTSDAKYGGQYNFGEVQTAIWKLVGFTDAQITSAGLDTFVTDNNRNVVSAADINFLVSSAQSAVASGNGVLPTDAFFSTVIDPAGNVQPLIVQLQSAKLGNYVWSDDNGNGVQDSGEAGVDKVVVELYSANGTLIASTTTGDDYSTAAVEHGFYQFAGLHAGDYQVKFIAPSYAFTTANVSGNSQDTVDSDADAATGLSHVVTLAAGQSNQTVDAGLVAKPANASLSGYVYEDFGNDGVRGAGEPVLAGVTVTLTGLDSQGHAVTASTVTNAQGFYAFTGLAAGTYTVTESQPVAYLDGRDTAGSNGGSTATNDVISNVVLAAGDNSVNNNFGELVGAQIRGTVYCDDNNDGIQQAGEVGLGGVTITLTGTDDRGNAVTASTVTAADGTYSFTGLRPGSYSVAEPTQPAGKLDGIDTAGLYGGGTASNDLISNIVLTQGLISDNNNFGEIKPASVSGFVYVDAGDDGVKSPAEAGIAGATVTLTGTNDRGQPVTLTTVTGADGSYTFGDLRPGNYTVTESQPAAYLDGKDTAGSTGGTVTNDKISAITLNAGDASVNNNFGELQPAAIGDRVWLDTNANGIQDIGETGVEGVRVILLDGNGVQVGGSTLTDATGNYLFDNLTPGAYSIKFDLGTLPAGYSVTTKDVGGNTVVSDSVDSDADTLTGKTITTVLDSLERDLSWDMGIVGTVGIDITKYVQGHYLVQSGGGTEGLTPGFWKNHSEAGPAPLAGWPETGLTPGQSYELIFGVDVPGTPSLIDALGANGGGIYALERHSGAALLNASDPYVDYLYTVAQVIAMTRAAILSGDATQIENVKNLFETQNQLGADLSTPRSGSIYADTPVYDANTAGSGPVIPFGGTAIFTYVVTNTGSTPLSNVTVTDDVLGLPRFVGGDLNGNGLLDIGEKWTYTASQTVTGSGDIVNLGTATGTDATSGRSATDVDAAHYQSGALSQSLGDRVWLDSNSNGIQDIGEAGVAGVTVQLKDTSGGVLQSAVTDVNGNYLFDVAVGSYQLSVLAPTGYLFTPNMRGSNTALDSNIDPTSSSTATVNIALGQTDLSIDAGLIKASSLSGFVYYDANNDGIKGAAEVAIAGTTVTLTGINDLGAAVNTSLITGADGSYSFANLRPGTYALAESQPAGYVDGKDGIGSQGGTAGNDVFSNIVLAQGVNGTNNNFGELRSTGLSGFVYFDANNDGIKAASEAGIAGATVTLTGTNDLGTAVNTSTLTLADGSYSFVNLRPGLYKLTETQPAGYVDGKDTIGSQGGTAGNDVFSNIQLNAGVYGTNNNFGEVKSTGLSGFVYHDANNDGIKGATEAGIGGATVTLTGINDLGSAVNTSVTTAADGSYNFVNLRPGTYSLSETQPAGYLDGKDSIGSLGGNAANDLFSSIVLSAGVSGVNYNYGEVKAASLSGFVYFDANGDGMKGGTELAIAGATVKLTGTNDLGVAVNTSMITAADGSYSFGNLRPGNYTLTEVQPAGYLDGKDSIGSQGGTAGNDVFSNIALGSGVDGVNNNFGEVKAASLSGFVYLDSNNDGVKALGETAIAGAKVTLTGTDDLGATVNTSLTTASDGSYGFTNLRPGTYTLTESQPTGYLDGKDTVGTPGGTTGNDVFSNIVLSAGVSGTNNNFGELLAGGPGTGTLGFWKSWTQVWNGSTADDSIFAGKSFFPKGDVLTYQFGDTALPYANGGQVYDPVSNTLKTGLLLGDWNRDGKTNNGEHTIYYSLSEATTIMNSTQGGQDARYLLGKQLIVSWLNFLEGNAVTVPGGDSVSQDITNGIVWLENHSPNEGGSSGSAGDGSLTLSASSYKVSSSSLDWTGNDGTLQSMKDHGQEIQSLLDYYNNTGANVATSRDTGLVSGDHAVLLGKQAYRAEFGSLVAGQGSLSQNYAVTPIVIDLDGNGIRTISRAADSSAGFDLFSNGKPIHSGWVSGGDGFLAIDKNCNGKIDNLGELFGGTGKGAGFANLAAYDSNHDGLVNNLDAEFGKLMIWRDTNGNHVTDAGELMSLTQAGVVSLTVAYTELPALDAQGNLLLERSTATLASGASVEMTDVYFNVSADDAAAAGVKLPTMSELLGNDSSLDHLLGMAVNAGASHGAGANGAAADPTAAHADAGELLRRLAALSRDDSHSVAMAG